jgi:signal transduction histidine kinase
MIWNLSSWSGWGLKLLPGGVALGILLLLKLGLLQPAEQLGYQALFHLRGSQAWDNRLVLIKIDDASLAKLGRFPWSRQRYVELLDLLSRDSTLVVLDLLFSEPSPDDQQLAVAMGQHGQVILAQAWDHKGVPLLPVPALRQNAIGVGHILTRQDSDGIVRQIEPQVKGVPTLGVVTSQAYSLTRAAVPLPDLNQPFWLNWVGQTQDLPQYSFADVVEGKVSPEAFSDKIILVGVTATGIDSLVMPFDRNPPSSSVVLHATVIQNLLQQRFLKPWPVWGFWLLLIMGGPALSLGLSGRGWPKQVLVVAGLWAGWLILAVGLLNAQILLPIVAPLTLFLLTGIVTGSVDRLRETTLLRHQIHHLQKDEVLKEEFLRTASHELRAPVANIQCAITLLKLTDSPQDREEYLQILEDECQQEFAIINDLLDFQRLSNQPEAQLETLHLKDWLSEVVLPFQLRAEVNQQIMQVQVQTGQDMLTLDWVSLRRIVTELLNNASKYTPAHEQIQLSLQGFAHQIELEISNSGVTLPPSELDKLFQPFYRNVEVDHRQQGGTGLGLAIVKRLIEHLQGEIEVNNLSNWLTFTVRLPVAVTMLEQQLEQQE